MRTPASVDCSSSLFTTFHSTENWPWARGGAVVGRRAWVPVRQLFSALAQRLFRQLTGLPTPYPAGCRQVTVYGDPLRACSEAVTSENRRGK